ncbi:polymeric immunoglobulin receptor-like isoform X3 [Rhinatrema bivittatum]|uniref:polymeric immunoglobulin receptor-like isoform X3 n=1 Tax=Rhinatrema bivittatum TaxID=194408 RepID=UPI00112A94A7|nr:polymeric immunoglobulin receptor-like isoform X3 [Rhinatrema bivittatum]
MTLILLFSLLPALTRALYGPFTVTGELDSSITITCHYKTSSVNIHGRKFWCKCSRLHSSCDTVSSTTPYVAPSHKNRTSISDVPKNGTFVVKMEKLAWEDAGQYRCGIGQNNNGFFFPVNLRISEDPGKAGQPELIFGEQRGSVTIRCALQSNLTGVKKFWCRVGRAGCRTVADSDGYVGANYEGRIVIAEERDPAVFKVLINHLTKEDSGWYRCGMETFGTEGTWKDINLHVSEEVTTPRRPRLIQAVAGGPVSANCYHNLQGNFNLTYWCKWKDAGCTILIDSSGYVDSTFAGRISMTPHNEDVEVYTVVMKQLRETDAGWFWCGFTDGLQELTSSLRLRVIKARTSTAGSTTPSSSTSQRERRSPAPHFGSTGLTWRPERSIGTEPPYSTGPTYSVPGSQTAARSAVPSASDRRNATGRFAAETTQPVSSSSDSTLPASATQTVPRSWSMSANADSDPQTGTTTHEKSRSARTSTAGSTTPSSSTSQRERRSPAPHFGSTGLTWRPERSIGTVSSSSDSTLPASATQTVPRSWSMSANADSDPQTGTTTHEKSRSGLTYSVLGSQTASRAAFPKVDSRGRAGPSDGRSTTGGREVVDKSIRPGSVLLAAGTVGAEVRDTASPSVNTRGRTQSPALGTRKAPISTAKANHETLTPAESTLKNGPHLLLVLMVVLLLALLLGAGLLLLVRKKLQKQRAQGPADSSGTAMEEAKNLGGEARSDCAELQETDVDQENRPLRDPEASDTA